MRGMERTRFAPWGVHGGHCGASTGPAVINRGRPTERHIVKLDVLRLDAGDVVEIVTSGGWRLPRPLRARSRAGRTDVRFGFVSRKAAETAYGVVLKRGSHDLDLEKTAAKRGAIKRKTRKRPTFSLGAARDRYDRLWTPGAYAQLQRIMRRCRFMPASTPNAPSWSGSSRPKARALARRRPPIFGCLIAARARTGRARPSDRGGS